MCIYIEEEERYQGGVRSSGNGFFKRGEMLDFAERGKSSEEEGGDRWNVTADNVERFDWMKFGSCALFKLLLCPRVPTEFYTMELSCFYVLLCLQLLCPERKESKKANLIRKRINEKRQYNKQHQQKQPKTATWGTLQTGTKHS